MKTVVRIEKKNNIYATVTSEDRGFLMSMYEHFSRYVDGYIFSPQYKARLWDGKIRFYNRQTSEIYLGLVNRVLEFCKSEGVKVSLDPNIISSFIDDTLTEQKVLDYLDTLNPSDGKRNPLSQRDYQRNAISTIILRKRRMIASPTSCHAKGDKIIMSNSSLKAIEDVKVGDFVIGADGKPKEVLKTFKGYDNLYFVKPKNNRKPITVTGEHILCLKFTNEGKKYQKHGDIEYITVNDFLLKSNHYKHIAKLYYNDIEIEFEPSENDCELSPYFIGLYLGDGSANRCQVTTSDIECVGAIEREAEKFSMSVKSNGNYSYGILGRNGNRNAILHQLELLGIKFSSTEKTKCHERFIPESVFTQSIDYRLNVLAGLIDSDGHLANGTYYDFCVKSERLRNDVVRIATQLGLVCSESSKFVNGVEYFRCAIMGNIKKIPVRLVRKQSNREVKRNPYTTGFSIESIGVGEYYGIQVSESLYLHESGMVTHNSGKSFILYAACRFLIDHKLNKGEQILLVVPTIALIKQMKTDFIDYSQLNDWAAYDNVSEFGGGKKDATGKIVVATWQSLIRQPPEFFKRFRVMFVDEAHQAKAKSIIDISKMCNAEYRIGLSGSFESDETTEMTLNGLFANKTTTITTREMIDQGYAANLDIKCIQLKHPEGLLKPDYQTEIQYLSSHDGRNRFILDLAEGLEGNTLILFQLVEKQGKPLYEMAKKSSNKKVYMIYGKTDVDTREDIRKILEKEHKNIILKFGSIEIECKPDRKVKLSNGETKPAIKITKNDDVCDDWIRIHSS